MFLGGGSVGSGRVEWFGAVVVLVALFGGLFAVFASSARADSHTAVITVDCDRFEVTLSNYDNPGENPEPNGVTVQVDGRYVIVDGFADSFSGSGALDPNADQTILFSVFDPEDPDGSRGWTFQETRTSPVCPTTTATTAPTAPTVTTAVTVAPSTLPFTGVGAVSSALLGVVLFGSGVLGLLFARRAED